MHALAVALLFTLYLGAASERAVTAARRRCARGVGLLGLLAVLLLPYLLTSWPALVPAELARFALYLALPTLLLLPSAPRAPGWREAAAVLALWLPIETGWLPRAEAALAPGLTLPVHLLTAVCLALALGIPLAIALLATLAGLIYGEVWRRTGKVSAAAISHAVVNTAWLGVMTG